MSTTPASRDSRCNGKDFAFRAHSDNGIQATELDHEKSSEGVRETAKVVGEGVLEESNTDHGVCRQMATQI